jgi:HAMP domain-containing protein/putative methionine-R-sulfoxide reductase with GAF domain
MSLVSIFLNFKLRVKLLLAFGSILLLTVILVAVFFVTLKRINQYESASEVVDGVNIDALEMVGNVNYFIFEGYKEDEFQRDNNSHYINTYKDLLQAMNNRLTYLENLQIHQGDSITSEVHTILKRIDHRIDGLKELFLKRGFKDYGLEGKLRNSIHRVEKSTFPYDKTDMLTLRRHEKDFFLRKDTKYQKEFNTKIETFISSISNSKTTEGKDEILNLLDKYREQFNEIIETEKEIGLRENEGIKGEIKQDLDALKKNIHILRADIKSISTSFKSRATWGMVVLFTMEFVLAIVLAIVYAHIITKAIKELRRAMQKLAEGLFPAPLVIKSQEEIGQTKSAFNQMLERMKAATQFAESLGQGNLKAEYASSYADDILARALINMQSRLSEASEKEAIVSWANSGIAKLNDILKNESHSIEVLGDDIIRLVINYLHANQGALYLLDDKKEYLERISTYAYSKKKYIEQKIPLGQGLVGQAVLEGSAVVMTEVPQDFVRITSGLGEAVPGFLVIVPLQAQDQVIGALEIASFRKFEKHEVQFLERLSENIASILNSRRTAAHTSMLLKEAQEQTQRLISQEEEIRQNAEEMQAIQEQLEREKKMMEEEILSLRKQLKASYSEV